MLHTGAQYAYVPLRGHKSSVRLGRSSEADCVFGPFEDSFVRREFVHCRVDLVVRLLLLQVLKRVAALVDGAVFCKVFVGVHLGKGLAALRFPDVVRSQDTLIPEELVLVAFQSIRDADDGLREGVDVFEMLVVVAAVIVLHAVVAVNEEILKSLIIRRPVVVVNILLRRVVVDEEVLPDFAPLHDHRWLARPLASQIRLSVPRVKRPVVARLAARREDEVAGDLVAAAEAVVHIYASPRTVEENVARDGRSRRLGLHEERRLLLV
mmetsp:Transcript_13045/g.45110  ORF Transcript_13045/g.45110 Transcript_13045/m.45110 type:complete len:266 (+) Transcript_13045:23-820(+)